MIEYTDEFEMNEAGEAAVEMVVLAEIEAKEEAEKKLAEEKLAKEEELLEEVEQEFTEPEVDPDFEWVDPEDLELPVEEPLTEEPLTEEEPVMIEEPVTENHTNEDTKQSLPVWLWPVVGTGAALLIIATIVLCYVCSKKQTPQESEKSEVS